MFSFVYQDSERKYIPVTEGDIRRIEEKFGVIFPEILKYYYIKYNAKYIHTVYFFVDSDNYEISIDDIIPLLNNIPNYDVESVKTMKTNMVGYLKVLFHLQLQKEEMKYIGIRVMVKYM